MCAKVLGPVDSAFYYVDRPETPMNIGAVTIFNGKIAYDDLCKLVDSRIYQAPIYQQRLIQAPWNLGQPTWAFDPDFRVGNHVFRITLDLPGTDEQLRTMAGHLVSGMLDRSKPLWEMYLIEGLGDNRTALLFKVHHCMVDGLAAVKLFTLLLDVTPDPPSMHRKPLYDPPYLPGKPRMIVDAVLQDLPHRWDILQKVQYDIGFLGSVLMDKEKRRRTLIGLSYLINDNLQPIKRLPINGQNTGKMTVAWSEFSLNEVRTIRSDQHASVNDVMLTVLSGAIDSYVRAHGGAGQQKFLRLIVPVNMRSEGESGDFGNRISVLPVDIPFGIKDPLERLRAITEYTQVMKQSSLANGLDLILTLPSLTPTIVQPTIWGLAPTAFALLAHAWCTNVAGPQIPVYLLGHPMLHSYGYFPLNPSMGVACVITSYNQRIAMTVIADAGIVPNILELKEAVDDCYLALRRAAKVQELEPIRIEKPSSAPTPAVPPGAEIPVPPPAVEPVKPAIPTEAIPAPEVGRAKLPILPVETMPDAEITPAEMPLPRLPVIPSSAQSAPAPEVGRAKLPILPVETMPDAEITPADTRPVPEEALSDNGPSRCGCQSASSVEMAAPAVAAPTGNGRHTAEASTEESDAKIRVASDPGAPEVRPILIVGTEAKADLPTERYKLFSEEWAQAYRKAINNSDAYCRVSTRWDAGALAFVMKASPQNGFPRATAVYLDLHRGQCLNARSLLPVEAQAEAAFVIEGDYATWMRVLSGKTPPLMMLILGRLYLKKGSMAKLLPYTQSAQELVNCAQGIS